MDKDKNPQPVEPIVKVHTESIEQPDSIPGRETAAGSSVGSPPQTEEHMALDDERRVRVLSPGMLVLRRFLRNRLAIVGLVILIVMFLFSFLGGVISPYTEAQQFLTTEMRSSPFAGVLENDELRFTLNSASILPGMAQAYLYRAIDAGDTEFEAQGVTYSYTEVGKGNYVVGRMTDLAEAIQVGPRLAARSLGEAALDPQLERTFLDAVAADETGFEYDGQNYSVRTAGRFTYLSGLDVLAVGGRRVIDYVDESHLSEENSDFRFHRTLVETIGREETEMSVDGVTYTLQTDESGNTSIYKDDEIFATFSSFVVQPINRSIRLSLDFKEAALNAVRNNERSFEFARAGGEPEKYTVERQDNRYEIRNMVATTIYDMYAPPRPANWLGTDGNGMDMLTRLMYGGRISLMVGFIVVLISLSIGVVLGGLSGYFGGWIDMLVMRMVDVSYCIPTIPILLIVGAIMDQLKMPAGTRLRYLMVVLGVLSWSGIARMVRGQILSLREQEFMTAAEATGISVGRRIFRHLIPNVIPQLIVIATMSLGSTILTESTLSFLGLGVKFPYATWGNIINAVNNIYVMTNFWYAWIPAGFCILITVLAFNFVGDGLRDAFDPKMKR